MTNSREAFVTTLNTDNYLPGVLVLDRTIRDLCIHRLFVLVSHDLDETTYETLRKHEIPFDFAEDVVVDAALLTAADQVYSHWAKTFFKFRIFEITRFTKIVYIDCDIMVLEPIDDLFDRPNLSAAIAGRSFPGNEDWRSLNSGVMVIEPKPGIVENLISAVPKIAANKQIFGDQDVLAAYFDYWESDESLHLPEEYNVFFSHYRFYLRRGGVKALHFIGKKKPWMMTRRDLLLRFLSCTVKGNIRGAAMLLRYCRYLREAADE